MYIPKFKHKFLLLMCVVVAALGLVAIVGADNRPANPTMDYVWQNYGIYDTYYCNFEEPDCRACHGTSTAIRHHSTEKALLGQCLFCHRSYPITVPPERDCKVCHIDGGEVGDFGAPHHRTDAADSGRCTSCHDPNLLAETNKGYVPEYPICNDQPVGCVAPSPYSCENCHWPSGSVPHEAATLAGNKTTFLNQWYAFVAFPKPTVDPLGTPNPAPIEANGPMFSGTLWPGGANLQRPLPWAVPAKPYQPMDGTHHEVNGKVYPKCYDCHGTNPDTDPSWDPTNVYLIRMCENCHDVWSLHAIQEHTTDGYSVYQSGGGIRAISANQKCVACHSDDQGKLPSLPAAVPVLWYDEPSMISPGGIVTLYHTAATTFGAKMDADRVQIGQDPDGAGPLPVSWVDVPIYSWTEDRIEFVVPGWTFQPLPTPSWVRVVKQIGVALDASPIIAPSNALNLGIRKHPEIASLVPNSGGWGTIVTVNGVGFFANREAVGAPNPAGKRYGYSTYVELNASNDKYRAIQYGWTSDTSISFKVGPLYDTKYGQAVRPENLYQGCWNVSVVTDYFQDLGVAGQHLLASGAIDPADILLYREISDPICFTVTNQPRIFSVNPKTIPGGNTTILYGVFFGPTKGTSYVVAGIGPKEVLGDSIGDEDGVCEPGAPNFEVCKLTTTKVLTVLGWSNTRIKVRIPTLPAYPKNVYIQVIVPGASPQYSNLMPIKIVQP